MSEQSNQPTQNVLTPQELRQYMLDVICTEQQAIEALSDEELETIAGGVASIGAVDVVTQVGKQNSLTSNIGKHYKTYQNVYEKTSAAILVSLTGGSLTAEGVKK